MILNLFLLVICGVISGACNRSGDTTNVAGACERADGSLVAVEGYLILPNFTRTTVSRETDLTTYELSLADRQDAEASAIRAAVIGTRRNKANRILELPTDGYTRRDLQIFTDKGETLTSADRVRVTGELLTGGRGEPSNDPCILKVERIERP